MHMDSSPDQQGDDQQGSTVLNDERIHVFEEKEAAEQTAHISVSQHCPYGSSTSSYLFLTELVESDPFHADWAYW
jgi:hypothetical protein